MPAKRRPVGPGQPGRAGAPWQWRHAVRWPRRTAALLRRLLRSVLGPARRRWRRSLQLRVVGTTLAVSVAVVGLVGFFLVQQIADGLLSNTETAARSQILDGMERALLSPGVVSTPPTPAFADGVMHDTTSGLQAAGGQRLESDYYVMVLAAPRLIVSGSVSQWGWGSVLARQTIPASLSQDVTRAQRRSKDALAYTQPTRLVYSDGTGPRQPALAVGIPLGSYYQLYYVFPLTQDLATIQLVERTVILGGIALVALLALIAYLVTRWVVIPVRRAAAAAHRVSAGNLDERMQVHGIDDLAALATSFNEMAAGLQEKIAELQDLSQVQRQFVSDVSHELRTPLTTIRIAADVLYAIRDELDASAARSAELLQGQLERFEALLGDLLEISRYDANAATLDAEPIDICDLARRSADVAQQLAERRNSRIEFRLPAQPCVAEADRRRVERILRNLLVNAVEHGEGGDVLVTVAGDRDSVAVAVRDHGVGLKPGEEQLVFDRFWRADPARARTSGGTGLGLSIALEDARLHGGWLEAWGEQGRGSVFRLTLPRVTGARLEGSPLPLAPDGAELAAGLNGHPPPLPLAAWAGGAQRGGARGDGG